MADIFDLQPYRLQLAAGLYEVRLEIADAEIVEMSLAEHAQFVEAMHTLVDRALALGLEVSQWRDYARSCEVLKLRLARCPACGQRDIGQTGEYPCARCGLPTVWDAAALVRYEGASLSPIGDRPPLLEER